MGTRFGHGCYTMNIIELDQERVGERYKAMNFLPPLQGFKNDSLGGVVYLLIGGGQPFRDSASGIVKEKGEGSLFAILRFAQGFIYAMVKARSFFLGKVLPVSLQVEQVKILIWHGEHFTGVVFTI